MNPRWVRVEGVKRVVVAAVLIALALPASASARGWERVALAGSGTWIGPASGPKRTLSIKAYSGGRKLHPLGGPRGTTWRGRGALLNVSLGRGAANHKTRFRIRYSTTKRPLVLWFKIA